MSSPSSYSEPERRIQALLDRRRPLLRALFALTLITVGCAAPATETTPAPSVTAPPPSATPVPPTPTETPVPTPSPTPFVPRATIRIASHSPQSGDLAALGTDIMRGAELAVAQLGSSLQELGYAVELAPYDDQNDIGVAVENAEQIIADTQILCGVGNATSAVFVQLQEVYHQAGLAFIAPSTTSESVTTRGYLEVNRLMGRNDVQGTAAAQFASAEGLGRVFIIRQDSDYGRVIADHFTDEADHLGIQVVGDVATDAVEAFGPLIDQLLQANADLVFFSTRSVEQAGAFFREARAEGYRGTFLGPDGLDTPALLEFAGPLLIDGGGMYYTNMVLPASGYPGANDFAADFETLHGTTPYLFAAQAYDAAAICMLAIQEAAIAKGGDLPTRAEVAAAIRAVQDYVGITGIYSFDENGDPSPARYFVFQVISPDPEDWSQNALVAELALPSPTAPTTP